MREILQFLSELSVNNDREWFTANKARYDRLRREFESFSASYIEGLSKIDPALAGLTPKDCIWRIYRDVRFSSDKRPYKEWMGVFPAAATGRPKTGGKKSQRGGYYFHLQPGNCMFAGGIWNPSPELLKVLRSEILVNADEVRDIMATPSWKRYFADFDTNYMLKKEPKGFDLLSVEEEHRLQVSEWIKRKSYTFSTPLTDEEASAPDLLEHLLNIAAAAKPMNDFLNYTFEEYGEFPDRAC